MSALGNKCVIALMVLNVDPRGMIVVILIIIITTNDIANAMSIAILRQVCSGTGAETQNRFFWNVCLVLCPVENRCPCRALLKQYYITYLRSCLVEDRYVPIRPCLVEDRYVATSACLVKDLIICKGCDRRTHAGHGDPALHHVCLPSL